MVAIPLGTGDYNRRYGRIPRIRLINMFLEKDPSNGVDQLVRLQRPGLTVETTIGGGPIWTMWRQDGTFNGEYLVQSDKAIYRLAGLTASLIGSVTASEPSHIAARQADAIIVNDAVAYLTTGTVLTPIAIPDDLPVQSVATINSYYILTIKNSQRWYWIAPGSTTVDPLDFASAERTPDNLVCVAISGDEVWFLGQSGAEVWVPSGDADAPFTRASARVYPYGCKDRDSVVVIDTAIAWVTQDCEVVIAKGSPSVISDNSIAEQIRKAASPARSWTYKLDQHQFYIVSVATGTFAFDLSTQRWSRYQSKNREAWRAQRGAQDGTAILCGDIESGTIWRLDPTSSRDAGENMSRELIGGVEIVGAPKRCDNISFRVASGWETSPDFEPYFEVCWSDDQGNIWSQWRQIGMGKQGHYDKEAPIRKLGMMRAPGRIFWFRMTDNAFIRVNYARMNELYS